MKKMKWYLNFVSPMKGLTIAKNPHLTISSPPTLAHSLSLLCSPQALKEEQKGNEVRIFFSIDRENKVFFERTL